MKNPKDTIFKEHLLLNTPVSAATAANALQNSLFNSFLSVSATNEIASLVSSDLHIFITAHDTPYPADAIEKAIGENHFFQNMECAKDSKAYLTIEAIGSFPEETPSKAFKTAEALSIAVMALELDACTHVFWDTSGGLIPYDYFRGLMMEDAHDARAVLWATTLLYGPSSGQGLATRGLAAFVGHEIAVAPAPGQTPEFLVYHVFNIADAFLNGYTVPENGWIGDPNHPEAFHTTTKRAKNGVDVLVLEAKKQRSL